MTRTAGSKPEPQRASTAPRSRTREAAAPEMAMRAAASSCEQIVRGGKMRKKEGVSANEDHAQPRRQDSNTHETGMNAAVQNVTSKGCSAAMSRSVWATYSSAPSAAGGAKLGCAWEAPAPAADGADDEGVPYAAPAGEGRGGVGRGGPGASAAAAAAAAALLLRCRSREKEQGQQETQESMIDGHKAGQLRHSIPSRVETAGCPTKKGAHHPVSARDVGHHVAQRGHSPCRRQGLPVGRRVRPTGRCPLGVDGGEVERCLETIPEPRGGRRRRQ